MATDPVVDPGGRAAPPNDVATRREADDREDAPDLRPAVLGRLEGLGLITVVRDADGGLVDANGSWRPADETSSLDELRETFPEGSVTTFAGPLIDSSDASPAEDVSLQVVVTRHGEYEGVDGRVLRFVNFIARNLA